jgi:hypothetical protein
MGSIMGSPNITGSDYGSNLSVNEGLHSLFPVKGTLLCEQQGRQIPGPTIDYICADDKNKMWS